MANAVNSAAVLKSASSSTIAADLPPSSRKTFLSVSLAAAMIRRPVGVDPVKVTMSTSGLVGQHRADLRVGTAEHVDHAGGDVGVVGDQLAERERDQRGVRCALEHHRAAGRQRGRELGQCELVRIVVGDDRRHHPAGFFLHPAVVLHAAALDVAEVLGQRVGLQQIRVVRARSRSAASSWAPCAQRRRGTDFGDGQLGELVAMVDQRLVQLLEAADPQLGVGRPVGGVERAPRRRDRRLGVGHRRVGRVAEHLSGGGIERGKRPLGVSTSCPSISIRRSACRSAMSAVASREMVDASVIQPPQQSFSVMETSFSSSANHTFAG